jgi:hypothetical protein
MTHLLSGARSQQIKPKEINNQKLCGLSFCNNKHKSMGYCNKHYQRLQTGGGSVYVDGRSRNSKCIYDGCKSKHYAKSMCRHHYNLNDENKLRRNKWARESETPGLVKAKLATKKYKQTANGRYRVAKDGASRRGILWSLDFATFLVYANGVCTYCGCEKPPEYQGSFIDRINTNLGYSAENVESCCWNCNKLKGDLLSKDEMIKVIEILRGMRGGLVWKK